MKGKLLFTIFALTLSLLSTSCGSGDAKSNKLQLLYFGKPKNDITEISNNSMKLPYRLNDDEQGDRNYKIQYGEGIDLEAHVKNIDRLAFLDIVVYSASTGKKYVFNDGNGDYRVESTTVLSNDVWTTKLRFSWIDWELIKKETDSCFFDSFLEIEEINFLNVSGSVAQTNIAKSDVKRVNIHATNPNHDSHNWSILSSQDPTCTDYGGEGYICTVCGETEYSVAKPPLGHSVQNLSLQNKVSRIVQNGDKITGICSRCHQTVYEVLPDIKSPISLELPNSITTIADRAFEGATGLVSITIPESVTSIGECAFAYCSSLKTVYFESPTPPNIGSDVFCGTWDYSNFQIIVPCGYADEYKAVNAMYWQDYAVSHILGEHIYGEWSITKAPTTCADIGEREPICSRCGFKDVEEITIPHTWTDWVINNETNKRERECSVCGKKQTRSATVDSITNSDGKLVNFVYDESDPTKYYESIKITDGTIISGGIGDDGKMDNLKDTVIKWHLPVYDTGEISVQLSAKMSLESHAGHPFDPSIFTVKVNDLERPSPFPNGRTYSEIGLTTEVRYFSFATYKVTTDDIAAGEIEIEFIHRHSSYRLLFTEDLRIVYS